MGMVDIGDKENVKRTATAEGFLRLGSASVLAIRDGSVKKGDVFSFAEAAGMLSVKKTPELIPHCHPLPVSSIDFEFRIEDNGIKARCTVSAVYKTGVEMDSLVGLTTALLTMWDMVKYLEKDENGQYPTAAIESLFILNKTKER